MTLRLSPEASRALLGSPQASPSLGRFFARVSPQPSRPAEPPRPPQQALRVPLLPEGARNFRVISW